MNLNNVKTVYFIGIGGISMSGLAMVMRHNGYVVKGSDSAKSDITEKLSQSGIEVFIGQKKENITDGIDLAVYTAAISKDNPEFLELKERNVEIIPRSKLLGIVMSEFKSSVAVAGTHGKTTTTSMITQILIDAGLDPTVSIGGIIPSINSNTRIGSPDYFIAEACEYTNSFLELYPRVSIILNIDLDHIDYFKNMDEVRTSFKGFISNVRDNGAVVINSEIENYEELIQGRTAITFGFAENADWRAVNIVTTQEFSEFDILYENRFLGRTRLKLLGDHNISNALSACAAAYFLGVSPDVIIESVQHFDGTQRRFEFKGSVNGYCIYDDYAHHPREIVATLKAARSRAGNGKIWCVFQPHTYTRTKAFLEEFSTCFSDADTVILTDIYAAREKDPGDIHSRMLLDKFRERENDAYYFSNLGEAAQFLHTNCCGGDMVLTMGAGNIYTVGELLLEI